MIKMFLLSLYLLDIINTSKTSRASKMRGIVGICIINFNETLVKKNFMHLRYWALDPALLLPVFRRLFWLLSQDWSNSDWLQLLDTTK